MTLPFDAGDLPLVERSAVGEPVREARVAGVLLAAGESSRFDPENKLLADLRGKPVVWHAAHTLVAAPLDPVIAVVGHEADRVRAALAGLGVEFVENPDYAAGQATSVRAGLRAVSDADAVLFALGDMPFVLPRTVEGLIDAYRAGVGDALAAAYKGRRGNPVLFGSRRFDALADVEGDAGGRRILLDCEDAALIETGDPGVRIDIDTPGEFESLP